MTVPNLVQIRLGKWVKYNEFIYLFFTFFMNSQVRPVDGFSRLMAQTTRTRARMCIFAGFVDTAAHSGGEILPKQQS